MAEPFPLLNTSADQLHADHHHGMAARRRRKSSGLGSDICAGDTGAPALASSSASLNLNRSGDSPTSATFSGSASYSTASCSTTASYSNASYSTASSSSSPPPPHAKLQRLSKRRRARGLVSRMRQTMVKHTFVLPACILALALSAYALNPSPANPLHRFIFLSYRLPDTAASPPGPALYGKGPWDVAFVAFYTVVLSFTREFVMQELLRPLARRTGLRRAKQARFMEQAYTAIYFGLLGPAGLYVMSRTPVWYFSTRGMYEHFPHRSHEAVVKFYYLFQAAYWAQQAIVLILGMEKPRKDFKELVGHHIVSLALIALSYRFHFTYIGIAVYTTHDISDFFLATSKILNYIDHPLVGPYFFLFIAVWIYMRHIVNLRILYSLFTEFRTVGPFELNWYSEQYKCWISQYITAALLASLQALNLFWLFCIFRIAYRLVWLNVAEDDRSEDEDDDADAHHHRKPAQLPRQPHLKPSSAPAKQPSAKQPSAKQPSAKQPSAKQPSVKQPSVKQPSVKQAPVHAHLPALELNGQAMANGSAH